MTRLEGDLHRLNAEPVIRREIFFEDLGEVLYQLVSQVSVDFYFMVLLEFLFCNLIETNSLSNIYQFLARAVGVRAMT